VVLTALQSAAAFNAPLSTRTAVRAAHPRFTQPALSIDDTDDEKKTDAEGDALAAAFARRLDQEGGATKFKIKSSINDVKEGITDVAASAKNVASDAANNVGSAGSSFTNASPVALVGGLFAVVLLFSVVSAGLNSAPVDNYTSDGGALTFGQRGATGNGGDIPLSAYQPEYGRQ